MMIMYLRIYRARLRSGTLSGLIFHNILRIIITREYAKSTDLDTRNFFFFRKKVMMSNNGLF